MRERHRWSVRDDRPPYWRDPEPRSYRWLWLLLAAAVIAVIGYLLWQQLQRPSQPEPVIVLDPPIKTVPQEPEVRHPVEPVEPKKPLPPLDESDAFMRESLSDLIGTRPVEALVNPEELVRRFVATVDNLPRRPPPGRMVALNPVPGSFTPGAANVKRYAPYVKLAGAVDARRAVALYRALYPLFQRAYEELGYPGRYFNDRFIEAIDDLLAAPELKTPPRLVQPKVLYQYADPDLERRSAGQKIMMRMGAANAAVVRAKLREIRAELLRSDR
jgi:hypothetical protein